MPPWRRRVAEREAGAGFAVVADTELTNMVGGGVSAKGRKGRGIAHHPMALAKKIALPGSFPQGLYPSTTPEDF